mmetsp:Transcript_22674/g.25510  ORF Transcript_22674/g.25510 Transcript_22674/m.25510 type:complete len:99 (+) Transcript_22674:38-334(+)
MSAFNRVANVVQKGAVTGLFSVFAWQLWQIGAQCTEYGKIKRIEKKNEHELIMEVIAKKVEEESQPYAVDTIPDRYDAEDDSYLKKVPNLKEAISRGR